MSRSRVPRPEHDHVRLDPDAEPLELPFEPSTSITARQPQNTVTDLPLPHSGNGGSHGAHDPSALLAEALTAVPQPPVEQLDTDAVLAWAAIDGEAWATFSAVATRAGTTVARYVGLTIEAAVPRSPG